jgi:Flp pilus assembly pilin Flp
MNQQLQSVNVRSRQKGASMIEYALVVGFVAAIAAVILSQDDGLGDAIKDKVTAIATCISTGTCE